MMRSILALVAAFTLGLGVTAASASSITVFQTDFEGSLPAEFSPGTATLTGVQGYAGLGPAGNQFSGNFLRSETGNHVTLSLTGLPAHDTITLEFLFAAIDSLDGTGVFPAGDFFQDRVRRSDALQRVVRERLTLADPELCAARWGRTGTPCRPRI
jgi:hypothetical protein